MVVVLMVAEKPSLARSLADILSGKQSRRRRSMCSACDVYEFEGELPLQGGGGYKMVPARFKMTSVCGHVMSLDFLPAYNNWEKTNPVCTYAPEIASTLYGMYIHVHVYVNIFRYNFSRLRR